MALCRWGAEDGKNGTKEAIVLNDCFPLDSNSFAQYRLSGDQLEERGKPPQTVHMFVKTDRQQSRLYASAYGEEHLNERLDASGRLNEIHEECPEFFTPTFLVKSGNGWYISMIRVCPKAYVLSSAATPMALLLKKSEGMHWLLPEYTGRHGNLHQYLILTTNVDFGTV